MDLFDDLRDRILGTPFRPENLQALGAIMAPMEPFTGAGSTLVVFGSVMVLLLSVAIGLFSFAGLLWAMFAIYLIGTKVFGIQIDLPEEAFSF